MKELGRTEYALFHVDWMRRFLAPGTQTWLAAFALALAVALVARLEWLPFDADLQNPVEDWLFRYVAMPFALLFVGALGDTRVRRTKRHRPQNWASLFLGLFATAAFEVQVLLPGIWPMALVVPTTPLFWVFYRVKHDAPGAVDAFWSNRAVVALRTFVWAVRDRMEGPEWRDRLEERYAAYETELWGSPGPLARELKAKRKAAEAARRRMEADVDAELGLAPAPSKKPRKARR